MTEEPRALVPQRATTSLDTLQIADALARSGYFPDIKSVHQAITQILAGQEIGLGPVASLKGVYIINGVPSYSANTIAAAIKRSSRYDYKVRTLTDESCALEFFDGAQAVGTSTFTVADAKRAGLGGANWTKYPRNMLFSRALTNGARWYCPDALGGNAAYTPDEIRADVDYVTGEIIDGEAHALDSEPEPQQREAPTRTASSAPPARPRLTPERVATGPADPASAAQRAYIERLLSDIGRGEGSIAARWDALRQEDALRTLPAWDALTVQDVPLAVNWLLEVKKQLAPA